MARNPEQHTEGAYRIGSLFVDRALHADDSMFTPGTAIWTLENLEKLHRCFNQNPDVAKASFMEKFRRQLDKVADATIQLAAEMFCAHLSVALDITGPKKRALVAEVLGWMKNPASFPEAVKADLERGLCATRPAYFTKRPNQLWLFVDFVLAWKRATHEEREGWLADPWSFWDMLFALPIDGAYVQRNVLLHMVHPDTFEDIASRNHKKALLEAFGHLVSDEDANRDRKLFQIRKALEQELGKPPRYYEEPLKSRWRGKKPPKDKEPAEEPKWRTVRDQRELATNIRRFGAEPPERQAMVHTGRYFAYDSVSGWVAPGKLAGIHDMSVDRYQLALNEGAAGSVFDGTITQKAIKKLGASEVDSGPPHDAVDRLADAIDRNIGKNRKVLCVGPDPEHPPLLPRFSNEIRTIRRGKGKNGPKPHKPLMLLCAFEAEREGRALEYEALAERFGVLAKLVGESPTALYPFEHLRPRPDRVEGSPFWSIQTADGENAPHLTSERLAKGCTAQWLGGRELCVRDPILLAQLVDTTLELLPAEHRAAVARELGFTTSHKERTWWVFQCNPKYYDLARAVHAIEDFTWLVREHKHRIDVGDGVFLWQSGPKAGIYGLATVTAKPETLSSDGDDFERDYTRFQGKKLRARLRLDRALAAPLAKTTIKQTQGLEKLSIVRGPQGTNFQVKPEEARLLLGLIEATGPQIEIPSPGEQDPTAICQAFTEAVDATGLRFGSRSEAFVRAFLASAATKRFVILTGLSGSGKTQIAMKLGEWLGEHKVVAVRPDWTGSEALFGYENVLAKPSEDGRQPWHVPDTLAFMLEAVANPGKPYLLLLDEMNLAHVERYFADVLSGIESGKDCLPNLEEEDGKWLQSPTHPLVPFPDNLFVVGTVNVDETTYMFSPKVLDRANTIEFRVTSDDLAQDPFSVTTIVPCEQGEDETVRGLLDIALDRRWHAEHAPSWLQDFAHDLRSLHERLADHGLEFGHRTYAEAIRFACIHTAMGGQDQDEDSYAPQLDLVVLQKVLPRLHGSRRRLEPVLKTLASFADDPKDRVRRELEPSGEGESPPALPRSMDKIWRMTKILRTNQFVSFAE